MDSSPEVNKIAREIDRWGELQKQTPIRPPSETTKPVAPSESTRPTGAKIVLKRSGETAEAAEPDSISLFSNTLQSLTARFKDFSGNKQHLMSILDEALDSAITQTNKEALLLSALIIYYLRQNGYKTEPFVKRLKEAERLQKGSS